MATTLWGIGLTGDLALAENGWKDAMNANLRKLTTLTQSIAKDKDLATPPASPATGDTYIIAVSRQARGVAMLHILRFGMVAHGFFMHQAKVWRFYVDDEDADYRFNGSVWGIL